MIERAKGILMERHAIDEQHAFELLRDHSKHTGRKLIDVAKAIVDLHRLLPSAPGPLRSAAFEARDAVPGVLGQAVGRCAAWWN